MKHFLNKEKNDNRNTNPGITIFFNLNKFIFEKYKIPNDTNIINATVPLLVAIIDNNKDA